VPDLTGLLSQAEATFALAGYLAGPNMLSIISADVSDISMQGKETIVAVIPTHEEEATIASLVVLTLQYADAVIIVDDGSQDRTGDIAEAVGATVLYQVKGGAAAPALTIGLAAALKLNPDCTVLLEGRAKLQPDQLPGLIDPVLQGKADLVMGSRFLGKPAASKYTDSNSGYRALSQKALRSLDLSSGHASDEANMIKTCEENHFRILEVPVTIRSSGPEVHPVPKLRVASAPERLLSLVGLRHPLLLFTMPGVLLIVLGICLGLAAVLQAPLLFQWTLLVQGLAGAAALGLGAILGIGGLLLYALRQVLEQGGRPASQSGPDALSRTGKKEGPLDRIAHFLSVRHPLLFFGLPGLIVFVIGLGFMLLALMSVLILFSWAPLTQGLCGLLLAVAGALVGLVGLVLNALRGLRTPVGG
jgi:hypothetical protein